MEHLPDFFQHFWDFVQNFQTLTNFFQMFLVFLSFSILKNFEKDTETESFSQFFLNRGGWVGKFSILSFLIKFHSTLYFLITLNNSLWQQKWKFIKKILSKTLTNFFQIFLVFLNFSILKLQSFILNSQSNILNSQSTILNSKSSIQNPHSSISNPNFSI